MNLISRCGHEQRQEMMVSGFEAMAIHCWLSRNVPLGYLQSGPTIYVIHISTLWVCLSIELNITTSYKYFEEIVLKAAEIHEVDLLLVFR